MADDGSFKPDMLVWAKGMANWIKAGEVPELSGLFGPLHSPALEALLLCLPRNRHRWSKFTCKSPSIVMEKTSGLTLWTKSVTFSRTAL